MLSNTVFLYVSQELQKFVFVNGWIRDIGFEQIRVRVSFFLMGFKLHVAIQVSTVVL